MRKSRIPALGYLRTSSASNVGTDKDSETRQRKAIETFASRAGYEIVASFYDPAVSGKDPILARPGFAALIDKITSNGVRTVIIEDASRFARHLVTQETGIATLQALNVTVLASNGDDLTNSEDDMRIAMRQMAGVFAQLEKSRLVAKLRAARQRVKAKKGKCEGRKPLSETSKEAVKMALALRQQRPSDPTSLRKIAIKLAEHGHLNERGKIFNPKSIMQMLVSSEHFSKGAK